MKKFSTRFAITGDVIEAGFDTVEEAKAAILRYEEDDRAEDLYEDDYYEIYDNETETIVNA